MLDLNLYNILLLASRVLEFEEWKIQLQLTVTAVQQEKSNKKFAVNSDSMKKIQKNI